MFGPIVILMPILKKKDCSSKQLSGKDNEYPITLAFDDTTFKVTVTLKTNYQLDLTKSNSYELIGFDKEVLKTAGNNEGKKDTRSVSRYGYPQYSL